VGGQLTQHENLPYDAGKSVYNVLHGVLAAKDLHEASPAGTSSSGDLCSVLHGVRAAKGLHGAYAA
jgi:hypothetical protein